MTRREILADGRSDLTHYVRFLAETPLEITRLVERVVRVLDKQKRCTSQEDLLLWMERHRKAYNGAANRLAMTSSVALERFRLAYAEAKKNGTASDICPLLTESKEQFDKLVDLAREAMYSGDTKDYYRANQTLAFGVTNDLMARLTPAEESTGNVDMGAGPGKDKDDILSELDRIRKSGEKWSSYRKMAKRIGVSHSWLETVVKKHGSKEILDWIEGLGRQSRPRKEASQRQSEIAIESTAISRESNPADIIEDEDVKSAIVEIYEQARPKERENIDRMDPAERRKLAEAYLDQLRDDGVKS